MSQYALYQLQVAAVFGLLVGGLLIVTVLALRKDKAPPVMGVAVLLAALNAAAFAAGSLLVGESAPPAAQVAIKYLRNAPTVLLVAYVCRHQVRHYSAARSRAWVRSAFEWGPVVVFGTFAFSAILDLIVRPSVLDVSERVPVMVLSYNALMLLTLALYGMLSASVFAGAALGQSTAPGGGAQRLQNACGALALGGTAALTLVTFSWYLLRATLPYPKLAGEAVDMSGMQLSLIALIAGSVLVGLACHWREGKVERFTRRLLGELDVVADVTEMLAAAPLLDKKLNVPYLCMSQSAAPDFLDLPRDEHRRMDQSFRAGAILGHGDVRAHTSSAPTGEPTGGANRLLAASRRWDQVWGCADRNQMESGHSALHSPEARQSADRINDSGQELRESVSLVREMIGQGLHDLSNRPEWAQLVGIALLDAGLLPSEPTVSEKVDRTYRLAKYKVDNYRDGLEDNSDL